MGRGFKSDRLAADIRRIISSMLLDGIKDPRLTENIVNITDVDVTRDGSIATCYVSFLTTGEDHARLAQEMRPEDKDAHAEVLQALKGAAGTFRRRIGKDLHIRHVPELRFETDVSLSYGRHIDRILKNLDIPPAPEEEPDLPEDFTDMEDKF